tara:strand:- start:2303 stop:3799 length:1497 start_codon:yes stop_codon:yes gene_type:complete
MSNIVGIDLGTTFSAVAKLDDTGRAEIIENAEGGNITPSVVEFTSAKSFTVGEEAKKMMEISENVVHEVKRSMGSSDVKYEFFDESHSPTSISALILKKLKEDVESRYGPIDSAVVTVPANFTNEAREATAAAAEMIGLKVDFIINEPTAAALCYAFQSGKELEGNIAIYDLGGGTFDCSIAKITGKDIEILTSEGVAELGGRDFDNAILEIVKRKYKEETKKDLKAKDFTLNDAEECKKTLSLKEKSNIRVLGEIIEISREEFENSIVNLMNQAELAVESALSRVDLKMSDIKDVVLVGGSTRIPLVQESIEKVFGKKAKLFGNPDESVALGAAIYAAYKSDSKSLNPLQRQAISKLSLSEVAPHFFGTLVLSDESGVDKLKNMTIIAKDEKIPCSITEEVYTVVDNQTELSCKVTQSSVEEDDPEFVRIIWEGNMSLPGGRPAGRPVKVTYSYTEDGRMKASFLDVESGNNKDIELHIDQTASAADDFDIDQFKVE